MADSCGQDRRRDQWNVARAQPSHECRPGRLKMQSEDHRGQESSS
jgi:hypothetical protein